MKDANKVFDGLLILQYRAGNKEAISVLVKKYHLKLCKQSYWYTRDMEASKDIVQDCWGTIISKSNGLKNPNVFGSWAMRIVTRKTLDYLTKKKRDLVRLQEFQKTPLLEDDSKNNDTEVLKLRKALKLLPKEQQMVLQLFYTEAYSIKEISTILDISLGTVKSRMFHAREKLKTIIK